MFSPRRFAARLRSTLKLAPFPLALLMIEVLDELVFGAREAAWPLIRTDLKLTYGQIGLLLTLPNLVSFIVEPFLGILGDVWKRRALILGGGLVFAGGLAIAALSQDFTLLLLSFMLLYPASGAFVSLSQAALMDLDETRHEHNMARWTLAGSIGVVAGPLALSAALALGSDWRGLFWLFVGLTLLSMAFASRFHFPRSVSAQKAWGETPGLKGGFRAALASLKDKAVVRWLVLLEFSDLMLDVFYSFLALYFVDVVGLTPVNAGLAVSVWLGVGLFGDFLLIPLLERMDGLDYLRISVLIELLLYPAFLLVPNVWFKLVVLGLLGLFNAGWYAILQGRLYSSMPGRSGTVITLGNLSGLIGIPLPLLIGWVAQRYNLAIAMWLILLAPLVLLIGLPRRGKQPDRLST